MMSGMIATYQARFAEALLGPKEAVPDGLVSWSGAPPLRRFEIYRNNVTRGLVQALAIRFPATETIVGTRFFSAMAREYVLAHPPNSPVLLDYGKEFEDFVRSFAPAAELRYLPVIVRLENARMAAYHAADATPVNPQRLTMIDISPLEALKFALHPSFGVIRSAYPVVTIWGMNTDDTASVAVNGTAYPLDASSASLAPKVVCGLSPGPDGVAFINGMIAGANTPSQGNYSYQDVTVEKPGVVSIQITGLTGAGWGFAGASVGCAN